MSQQWAWEEAKRTKMGGNGQSKKMGPVVDWPRVVEMGGVEIRPIYSSACSPVHNTSKIAGS
jgi:hypothetical protein